MDNLFVSEILKGIAQGYTQGLQIKGEREKSAAEQQYKTSALEETVRHNKAQEEIDRRKESGQKARDVSEARRERALELQVLGQIRNSSEAKKIEKVNELEVALDNYRNLVDEYGYEAVGKKARQLDSAFAEAKAKWKEAANLGALTGPDVGLIEEALGKSTGIGGAKDYLMGGGKEGILGAIDQSKAVLEQNRERAAANLKQFYQEPRHQDLIEYLKNANVLSGALKKKASKEPPKSLLTPDQRSSLIKQLEGAKNAKSE